MTDVVVKIVRSRTFFVDFDESDAREWGLFAIKADAWRPACTVGAMPAQGTTVGVAAAIAAPDGRVAVWYSGASVALKRRDSGYRWGEVSHSTAARAAFGSSAAARFFDNRYTRGGDRDVSPLALAACRVLHAQAFAYEPSLRDVLLAEFATLDGVHRPPTPHIVKANDTALLAASALLTINNFAAARALLAGKGVCGS